MSFARIAYILPASETFGQLQISYGRMLQDVAKFIFIYFTVMIAFICGLTSLYSISNNEHFSGLSDTTGTLFWAAFGMGNSKAPQIVDSPSSNTGTNHVADSLMGQDGNTKEAPESEVLAMVEVVGYMLYGVYILGAVVVLINMLIAMMSNTFEEIQKSEDSEWKFARAKLWISFIEQGTTLPIPFNIIPTPKSILKVCRWFKACITCDNTNPDDGAEDTQKYEMEYKTPSGHTSVGHSMRVRPHLKVARARIKYATSECEASLLPVCRQASRAIMHRVVLRYIHKMKFERKGDSLKDEILDTREEVVYQLHSMYGRLSSRLEMLERDLYNLNHPGANAKSSPGGVSRRSSPGLSYSRSVSSRMARSRDRMQSLRAVDSDLNLHAHDGLDLLFNRRSRYRIRPTKDMRDRVDRSSLKDSCHSAAGADRISDSGQEVDVKETDPADLETPCGKANLSDGDKRNRKTGSVQHPVSSPSVSTTLTEASPRRESLVSVVSQSFSDSDQYALHYSGSVRVRTEREDSFSPRPSSERHRRRTDGLSDSRKGDNSTSGPGGVRWCQNVIKESSMEDQLSNGVKETSFSTNRATSLARSPLLRNSGKRRETHNHPNIDAPFGLPHRPNSESSATNTFVEYHESRPQTRDTIQGLVLDVQQVPFTRLDSKDSQQSWPEEGVDWEENHTGSSGSVFVSAPSKGSGKRYGRQDSQTSISTIGRLAAASSVRIFPMETKSLQNAGSAATNSLIYQEQLQYSTQSNAEVSGVTCEASDRRREERISDISNTSVSCPSTIDTLSSSTGNINFKQINSSANYNSDDTNPLNPTEFSDIKVLSNITSMDGSNSDSSKYGHHQTPTTIDSNNREKRIDERYAADILSKSATRATDLSQCTSALQQDSRSCNDRSCLRCSATELEPLSLAETEYNSSPFLCGQSMGHVNHVYLPETPPTPMDTKLLASTNTESDIARDSSQPLGHIVVPFSSTATDPSIDNITRLLDLSSSSASSTNQSSFLTARNSQHVQFDQLQTAATITEQGKRNLMVEAAYPHKSSAHYAANREHPSWQIDSHNARSTSTNYTQTSTVVTTASSPISPTAESSLAMTLEEHCFSDTQQDKDHHQIDNHHRTAENSRSKIGEGEQLYHCGEPERHLSESQPHQRLGGRYRKRADTGVPFKHPSSFSGTAAGKHLRTLHHHPSRDSLLTPASQRYMFHSNDQDVQTDITMPYQTEGMRSEHHPSYNFHNQNNASHNPNKQQQHRTKQDDQRLSQGEQLDHFGLFSDTSPLHSPEIGPSTAAAIFIPAMATNLLPFPLPIQSSVAFSHKPVSKQQAKQSVGEAESSVDPDKPSGDSTTATPKKKKTSLVSLVRGRRSDKSKDSSSIKGKHSRSVSLNRKKESRKLLTLHHQKSKEI
ncbi:short transient receptor potential channel 6 [Plakobranchus ocellatus]|uniref:Short transient receptor potential channel 6 n=1 Tax=Plakobranchus ocellatus TaxID=259542 RepID=A0AAV4C5Z0_9GAST|nr:short transient receptor potential channel 6 [Plakobranchus ocellatus]